MTLPMCRLEGAQRQRNVTWVVFNEQDFHAFCGHMKQGSIPRFRYTLSAAADAVSEQGSKLVCRHRATEDVSLSFVTLVQPQERILPPSQRLGHDRKLARQHCTYRLGPIIGQGS